ncbi:MAG: four helix bundle protein [Bacteroidota bacterium]
MPKIEKFEDLNCWKEARMLVKQVFLLCSNDGLNKDYGLVDQLKRASVSVMNNIAEGFGRFSDKEFIRFLGIASSSAQEVKSMSYILLDLKYINDQEFDDLNSSIDSTKNMILGLIKYLRTK